MFIARNRITLQAAILERSEAAADSHSFSKILQKILVVESFFCSSYRLTVQSSYCILKWLHQERTFSWKSSSWTVHKQLPTVIHFRKFLQKIPVIEAVFSSNCRLAVQISDHIRKWLHQECFLENLLKDFGAHKYHRL